MSTIIATTTAPATVNNTMANELTQSQSRLLLPSTATASPANSSLTVDLLNARVTNQNKALGLLTEQVFAMAVRLDETVKQSQIQHDKTIQQFTQQINDMAYQHKIQLENMARQYKDQLDDLDRWYRSRQNSQSSSNSNFFAHTHPHREKSTIERNGNVTVHRRIYHLEKNHISFSSKGVYSPHNDAVGGSTVHSTVDLDNESERHNYSYTNQQQYQDRRGSYLHHRDGIDIAADSHFNDGVHVYEAGHMVEYEQVDDHIDKHTEDAVGQRVNRRSYQRSTRERITNRRSKDYYYEPLSDISGEDLGGEEYEGDKGSDGEYKDPTDEGYREQSGEQSEVSNDDEYYKVMRRTAGKKANRERNHSDKGVVEIPVRTTRTEIFSEPIFNTLLDEVAELYFQLSQEETIRLEPDYRFSTPIRSLEDVWQRWIVSEKNRPSVWCLGAYSETWRKRFGLTEQSAYYIQRRLVYNVFRHLLRLDKGSLVERVARAKAKVQAEIEIAGSLYKYSRPPAKKKGDTNGKSTQNGYPTVARLKRLRSKSEN